MADTGSSELLREATRGFVAREAPLTAVRAGLEKPRALDRDAWRRAPISWPPARSATQISDARDSVAGSIGVRLPIRIDTRPAATRWVGCASRKRTAPPLAAS